jgi:molybdopterin/thiamine biosynthesis adenylyltransferase
MSTNAPAYHERFKDAPWYGKKLEITVGGAGGIGSWLAFALSRAGHSIYLYDFDTVEPVNVGGQMYGMKHVGRKKVEAITTIVDLLCGDHEINDLGKFGFGDNENSIVSNVTIMGFDNMDARKNMAEAWFKHQTSKAERVEGEINILIDGRMEAETGMLFAIKNKTDYERYMKDDMFPDADVPMAPCSYRATTQNGMRMAAEIIEVLNNHISNKVRGKVIREVPYQVSWEGPTKTYNVVR